MARGLSLGWKFLLGIGGVVALTVGLLFAYILDMSERAILDQVDRQSRALLQQVVLTRQWIADHGGVYIVNAPSTMENPFLPGTTVTDTKGKTYIFHNPAYVTRILSAYAEQKGLYKFHITSLKPLNPVNAPSEFEADALRQFESVGYNAARDGRVAIIGNGEDRTYQRIVPLMVESKCLVCHAKQGYREGEIRGGLSVMIPMRLSDAQLRKNRIVLSLGGLSIVLIVGVALLILLRRIILMPVDHLHKVSSRLIEGDYSARAVLRTGDELEGLAKAYNAMTDHIITSYQSMVKTLAAAVEARDPYTAGHVERVSEYSRAIAEEMKLEPKVIHQIAMGAILHDIGKIGIPDDILQKHGKLDIPENEKMRSHTVIGRDIVSSSADFTESVQDAILHHHEHFDGTGYPHGLKGEAIPIGDRIIAVADTFDAMVTDRPYRKGRSWQDAIGAISNLSNTQLDPHVVMAFIRAVDSGAIRRANKQ